MTAERIAAAFDVCPREWFLPPQVRGRARHDVPPSIGFGATNSQPWTVRYMLSALDVPVGARVLDVGSGSAWTTALLAHLVGQGGSVLGVEIVPELVTMGRQNLAAANTPWARIVQARPGVFGIPEAAPFDRILVSADPGEVPAELEGQLAVGGRMVVPADGVMWRITRTPRGIERSADYDVTFRFVPLVKRG